MRAACGEHSDIRRLFTATGGVGARVRDTTGNSGGYALANEVGQRSIMVDVFWVPPTSVALYRVGEGGGIPIFGDALFRRPFECFRSA